MAPRLAQPVPVGDLARILRVPIEGQADLPIDRLASLESADARSIGFLSSRKHLKAALDSSIGALIVSAELARQLPASCAARLISQDPYADYARLSSWFAKQLRPASTGSGLHAQAVVHEGVILGDAVSIDAATVIEADVRIGRGSRIGSGCALGQGVELGEDCVVHSSVVIYPGVRIGDRAFIHAGTVIGSDGFGFAPSREGSIKIEQLCSVRIGDDVEICAG